MSYRIALLCCFAPGLLGCPGSNGSSNASGISYDPDTAGLTAKNVQAAVDELAGRTAPNDHAERLTAAEKTLATLTDGLSTASGRIDALDTTVEALKAATDKIGALETKIAALEADLATAKSALQGKAAQVDLAATKTAFDALAAKTDPDLVACPEGMKEFYPGAGFCIEAKPRNPKSYEGASYACRFDGLSLCTSEQFATACGSEFPPDPPVMVADLTGYTEVITFISCDVPQTADSQQVNAYYCCVEKSALVYGKK